MKTTFRLALGLGWLVPFAAGDPVQQAAASALARSNPQYRFTRLAANAEFRLRVADHVQRQFFNGGVLTTEACRARFLTRSNEIYGAIAAESARWGDAKREPPRTRNVDWVREMNRVYGDYFAQRPGIVLGQLRAKGWYPDVAAPAFTPVGGNVTNGFALTLSAPAGTIYYTRDGSDPRLRGGAVSPAASAYAGPLTLTRSTHFKARAFSGAVWSALAEATFYVIQDFTELLVTEIMYHPPGATNLAGDGFELLELKNVAATDLELSGVHFTSGLEFTFPVGTFVAPGRFLVLVSNPAAFTNRYPGVRVDGVFAGRLSNSGETLTLAHATGAPIFGPFPGTLQDHGETLALQYPDHPDLNTNTGALFVPYVNVDVVRYNDQPPWPARAAGFGSSLERLDAAAYGNDPINWHASPDAGSPGLENTGNRAPLVSAGPDQSLAATNFPVAVPVAGAASDDGLPNPPAAVTVTWSQLSGPGAVWFADAGQPKTTVYFPGSGTFRLRLTANDGALQSSAELTLTVQRPTATAPVTLVPKGSVWKYLDDGSDQGVAWRSRAFDDRAWKAGPAPLGYGDANGQWPATTNSFGSDPNNQDVTTYYRRGFTAPDAASVTNLVVSVQRDDGVVVYLNGVGVFTNNLPAAFNYLTSASAVVGGADETTFYSQALDPGRLVSGTNVLAAEIHQANASSSDITFDLELAAETSPANQPPVADAGAHQTITLPAGAALNGSVKDDGLPVPPGMLAFAWTKVSGPGSVAFANLVALNTPASFSTSGTYILRLTASDGASSGSHDLTVTVNAPLSRPLRIESVEFSGGTPATLRLRFTALAGLNYTVQYRESLTGGNWLTLADVAAPAATQLVEVTDPSTTNSETRYYRLVTPGRRGRNKTGHNCWIKTGRDVGTKPDFCFPTVFALARPGLPNFNRLAPAQDRALRKRNLSGVGSPSV